MKSSAIVLAVQGAAALVDQNRLGSIPAGPGAGIKKVKPFKDFYKDGYAHTDCVKDYMLYHGDKHGDGKDSYKVGEASGVSIVHYTEVVAKMDRKPMTRDVCFQFCRTIPQMGFFGINNGRDCYCTPYFQQMAGDSSECDAPCDGDSATVCGGKTKSDIFSMHACNDAAEKLQQATDLADTERTSLNDVSEEIATNVEYMTANANKLRETFGKVGDTAVAKLCGRALEFTSTANKAAKEGKAQVEAIKKVEGELPLPDSATPVEIEAVTAKLQDGGAKAADLAKELNKTRLAISPGSGNKDDMALYYPIMYFVDKKYKDTPTTCSGDAAEPPAVTDFNGCAAACTKAVVNGCVGFNYIAGEKGQGLCFLFSKVVSAKYYAGCDKASFLQLESARAHSQGCMLKLADFDGIDLTPDGSGKCDICLKEAEKTTGCFE